LGIIVLYYRYVVKSQCIENSKNISRNVIIKLAAMSLTSNYCFIVSIPNISILLNIILSKFSIIFLFGLSYLYLSRRYYITHYIGIFITLCGISIAIYSSCNNNNKNNQITSEALFIIGIFVNNINHVYKEKYIKINENLNIFWLYFWVNVYQIIFGALSMPVIFIPNTKYSVDGDNLLNYFIESIKIQYFNYFVLLWMFLTEITSCALVLIEFNIVKLGSYVEFNIIHSFTIPLITLLNYFFMKYNILYYSEEQKFIFKFEDYISLTCITIGGIFYFYKKEFIVINKFSKDNEAGGEAGGEVNNKIDNV
jgi:drug/metabolite transporter (DMT)-like permease